MSGTYQRTYPHCQVTRGFNPQETGRRSTTLPPNKTNGLFWSGQVISSGATGKDWSLGVDDATPGDIAITYSDSKLSDIQAAKNLPGLLCSGQYTIETPFFIPSNATNNFAYTKGVQLTYCKSTEVLPAGKVNINGTNKASGFIRPAGKGEIVIGIVDENGPTDLRPTYMTAVDSTAIRENSYSIRFNTVAPITKTPTV
ncbi:MAG: hypothetical protein RR382_00970 [Tannerellaceae bacterium]